ncbi:uncharacterized protein IWZ02DRAFT_451125 [Phyllosticta citriasiana]|uniref:uncharacterized protein n=1 Tax=Phyllosticta citriasiana TaxID=595635 RepID=UPI0030FDA983
MQRAHGDISSKRGTLVALRHVYFALCLASSVLAGFGAAVARSSPFGALNALPCLPIGRCVPLTPRNYLASLCCTFFPYSD